MKIVQGVGWYFPDRVGGTEVYVAGLSRQLRDRGHELVVAAPDAAANAPRTYEHEGIRVYRYPIATPLSRDEAQGRVRVRGAERFHAWLAAERPDIVHFHTLVPGLDLHEVEAARRTGARIIATTHASSLGFLCARGTLVRWGTEICDGVIEVSKCAACALQQRGVPQTAARAIAAIPLPASERLRLIPGKAGSALGMPALIAHYRRQQERLISSVDRFVLLTSWAAQVVTANGAPPARLALNRLGCQVPAAARKSGPSVRPTTPPVRVGYLGRFDPIKGVLVLAEAIALLDRSIPICFTFAGPVASADEERIVTAVRNVVGADPRVMFEPAVPHRDVASRLAAFDVLCCPSVCLEGGPTVAIEAHAVGTPVIGSRIGGLAELVTDGVNGRLVAPGDSRTLASVLAAVAADPAGTIDHWRAKLPPARTMDEIATDYLTLYAA
jgi:glycosyltransferase involved in cell wall biosynthesis